MIQYIPRAAIVAEIEKRIQESLDAVGSTRVVYLSERMKEDSYILSFIDTLEVKEMDLELVTGWFDHIAQIADDRMTLTGKRMTDSHALDEIKCIAKNSSEFITKHYKAQKGE